MMQNVITFVIFTVIGIFIIIATPKMINYNAKSYPRIYTPWMKIFSLLLGYIIGIGLILLSFHDFILPLFINR